MVLALQRPVARTIRAVIKLRIFRLMFAALVLCLTALPIARMSYLMANTGSNSLSNEHVYLNGLIERMVTGDYDWRDYMRDTFLNKTHSAALPIAVLVFLARFADLNDYANIFAGIGMAVVALALLYDALTLAVTSRLKLLVLPALAGLLFSGSEVGAFSFSLFNLQFNIGLLGFALGLWAGVRFPNRLLGAALIVVGGLLGAWSAAFWVAAFPVLLVFMFLQGFRKPRHYGVWLLGALVGLSPYLAFVNPGATGKANFWHFGFFLELIGYPLGLIAERSALAPIGAFGIAMLAFGLLLLFLSRPGASRSSAFPSLVVALLGLLMAYQTAIFRYVLGSWYVAFGTVFWCGALSFLIVLVVSVHQSRALTLLTYLWGGLVIAVAGWLYFGANGSYLDKAFFWVRTPVSASCVLYYRTAPSFCERFLFLWGIGRPEIVSALAEPLERQQLSTLSPRQTWTLQGDFPLDNVRAIEAPGAIGIFWTYSDDGTQATPAMWIDFRHLNLFLHAPNEISWTVAIPSNVERADFHSAVAISESVEQADITGADGVEFVVAAQLENGEREVLFTRQVGAHEHTWQPFTLALDRYRGSTVTLHLSANPLANNGWDWSLFRYPYIDVALDTSRGGTASPLDLRDFAPRLSEQDAVFDLSQWTWDTTRPQFDAGAGAWAMEGDRASAYSLMHVCLSDYSHFYARLAVTGGDHPRSLVVNYVLDKPDGWLEQDLVRQLRTQEYPSFGIPLYGDGEVHEYTYPLRLLELVDPVILRGLRITFDLWQGAPVQVEDVRLIRSSEPSRCPQS